jgi:hypothetical protein
MKLTTVEGTIMQRLLLVSSLILLLTGVAYSQPFPVKHVVHPAFTLAGDDSDNSDATDNRDTGAPENAGDDSGGATDVVPAAPPSTEPLWTEPPIAPGKVDGTVKVQQNS